MICDKHVVLPVRGYHPCFACEMERLQETERLARAFVNAKGRYHSQQAMCDLMEHFGKPCTRPSPGQEE